MTVVTLCVLHSQLSCVCQPVSSSQTGLYAVQEETMWLPRLKAFSPLPLLYSNHPKNLSLHLTYSTIPYWKLPSTIQTFLSSAVPSFQGFLPLAHIHQVTSLYNQPFFFCMFLRQGLPT